MNVVQIRVAQGNGGNRVVLSKRSANKRKNNEKELQNLLKLHDASPLVQIAIILRVTKGK
jgi:hypothetical protein